LCVHVNRALFPAPSSPQAFLSHELPAKQNLPVSVQSCGSGERGEWITACVGGDQFAEVGEERAALLSAGCGGRERALSKPLAVVALGAEREFSVDDRCSKRAFGGVVGRLDPLDRGEGLERGPDLEQVIGEAPVPASAAALRAGVLEQRSEFSLDREDLGGEPVAVVVLVLVGAPGCE
jgi:hypothetical protein